MPMRAPALAVSLLLGSLPLRAAAHPGPGAAPEFVPGECVTVIDTRAQSSLALEYNVAFEDTTFGVGEIHLPDSKTHQFFAVAGAVTRTPGGMGYQLFPFDAAIEQPLALPLWLDQEDVERAAGAAGPVDMTGFTVDQVLDADVLDKRSDVSPYLRFFGDKSTRVPITDAQAQMGVTWQLQGLPAGLYSVGGYVFSPPFNDWAMRQGVVKLVDGRTDVPAAALEPIDAFLYAGQGRRVRGCVSAAPGSTLRAWVRSEDQPDAAWEPWLDEQPIEGDRFELCLANQPPGRAGLLRVRVVVTAPDGQRSVAYSPDTVLAVATEAGCIENDETCCPQRPASAGGEPAMGGEGAAAAAGSRAPPSPSAGAAAPIDATAPEPMQPAARPLRTDDDGALSGSAGPADGSAHESQPGAGGCGVILRCPRANSTLALIALWALSGVRLSTRRMRRHRRRAS